MKEKITFNNEKNIHIFFMVSVIFIIISLLLLSLNLFNKNVLLIILTILIINIIWLLNLKVVFIEISIEEIHFSSQNLFFELLGMKKDIVTIEKSYLCKFEIIYSNPVSIIVLFIQKNGSYYYNKIPLTLFSEKTIKQLEIQIIRKVKWRL